MFLKPLKIRSQNQLKTSDKKRLIEEICKHFPVLSDGNVENLFPKKEEIMILKIETGAKLLIPVYTVKDCPLLFVYNQILLPTLHMLAVCPNIVHIFNTHEAVLKKLVGGADLMLPGVLQPIVPIFFKHAPACISANKMELPVVVGVTAISSNDMSTSTKGKCVHTLHIIGDKLFNLKNLSSNILSPLEELSILMKKCPSEVENGFKDNRRCIQSEKESMAIAEYKKDMDQNKMSDDNEFLTNVASEEMDDLLMYTLFAAIKYSKGLTFPILTSSFFKTHMVPLCPPSKVLDFKKSSFKKCGCFMKHMTELGILKVEEQKKGVEHIVEFNYEHPFISEFYLDPSERPTNNKNLEHTIKPVISEAHTVTAAVLPVFENFNYKKGSVIDNSEIRKLVTQYVKQNHLQDETRKNMVNLNNPLKLALNVPHCTFEELIRNVYNFMTPCYKVTCGDSEIIHKGKLEPINISVAKRSGNKKVTLVDNIETYGININEFGNICQRRVAASTTIIRSDNSRKSSQLLIQGNQVLFVYNLLTEKCLIPKRYVKGLEFAPKKQH